MGAQSAPLHTTNLIISHLITPHLGYKKCKKTPHHVKEISPPATRNNKLYRHTSHNGMIYKAHKTHRSQKSTVKKETCQGFYVIRMNRIPLI